ncbi:MAG TPA: hypothetical protein VGW78_06855 [Candidatus Babeliales bacterium]|jgi:hypothetical protein|nr:hypothetical protein [Candidatus Babeliales bacterium]
MHRIKFYILIGYSTLHTFLISQDITKVYYNALIRYEYGYFDEAYNQLQKLYNQGIRNHTITSTLMLHSLRIGDWQAAKQYELKPYWWYDQDLTGRTILLTHDGGAGDAIMFIRYAKHLHAAGAQVIVQTPMALIPLFSTCPFISKCIPVPHMVPADYIYRISTPDLTLTMHSTFPESSKDIPYLFADPNLIAYWADRIKYDSKPRIGLCWTSSYVYNRQTGQQVQNPRSITSEVIASFISNISGNFYALVKGNEAQKMKSLQMPMHIFDNLDTVHGAFMDTAALMCNLDLVITVDTSIAHLAGALGIPVWVLLPAHSDFRWFMHRADSPWYPTMRLFRQKVGEDWQPVLQEVCKALQYLF